MTGPTRADDIHHISSLLDVTRPVHLVGVAGTGMSALALILSDLGIPLSGCDRSTSRAVELLEKRGIAVFGGHSASHLDGASALVYSSAVSAQHPELLAAGQLGIPRYRRAEFLGQLLERKAVVAVAGTHGKTTTTAMLAYILFRAGLDPWWMIGGLPRDLPCHGHAGVGQLAVVEADEYDASFLTLRPQISIVTSVEAEHLDYYQSFDHVLAAFRRFIENSQHCLLCLEDEGAASLARWTVREKSQTYGIARGDWKATQVDHWAGGMTFVAEGPSGPETEVRLRLWGQHNVLNGLAALVVASMVGVDARDAAAYLGDFRGVERRLQFIGLWKGMPVYDDYGHHPSEVAATREAIRAMLSKSRIAVVFQPHTYSRTRAMLGQFAKELAKFDLVLVAEVYPAREETVEPISGSELAALIPGAYFVKNLEQAREILEGLAPQMDAVLTMGAGDVWKLSWQLVHG
jgi:UDP-N-acetylmuramate--alanine ligase